MPAARKGTFDDRHRERASLHPDEPDFLFRGEPDPPTSRPGALYPVTDLELASRLSFFLWSSIPDDELLDARRRRAS